MKKLLFFICFYCLFGCNDKDKENQIVKDSLLQEINSYYNQNILDQERQVCFYLGNISFPYQAKQLTYPSQSRAKVWTNNELERRLELFSQLGLINKKTLNENEIETQLTSYILTKESQPFFEGDKFCAGEIKFTNIYIPNTEAAELNIVVYYQLRNKPEWMKNDKFINYFYRYNNSEESSFFKSNSSKSISLSVQKSRSGTYRLKNKKEIFIKLYKSNNLDKSIPIGAKQLYAYYDEAVARQLVKKSWDWNGKFLKNTTYWGEPDPIIIAPLLANSNVSKINNFILLKQDYELLFFRQKQIKSMTIALDKTIDIQKYSIFSFSKQLSFSQDGTINKYCAKYIQHLNELDSCIYKEINLEKDIVTWYHSMMHDLSYSAQEKKIFEGLLVEEFFHYDTYKIQYTTNDAHQIIAAYKNETKIKNEELGNIKYDDQQQLVKVGDKTLEYDKNNNIIRIIDKTNITNFSYDKNNQLIYSISKRIHKKNIHPDKVCEYSDHNEYGDWTTLICNEQKMTRKINYHEEQNRDIK